MKHDLTVGIDGRALYGNRAGIGRYVFELCRRLDILLPDAQFIVYSQHQIELPIISSRWQLRLDNALLAKRMKPALWLKTLCGRLCRNDDLDVFWAAATLFPGLPDKTRTISTVYDLNFVVVPETMSSYQQLSHRFFFTQDIRNADTIAAISNGTSERLAAHIGRSADLIVYPSVDQRFGPQSKADIQRCLHSYEINSPYFLAVATWEPRKNLELLIRTFIVMKQEGLLADHKLVLAGGRGWKDRRLIESIRSDRSQSIIALGYVPDEHLPPLYAGADVFVFPSIYEGFGIPVLEARACGARVVTTDIPELREAGGPDAVYVSPTETGIRDGIISALGMPRKLPRLDIPSWEQGAESMASALAGE